MPLNLLFQNYSNFVLHKGMQYEVSAVSDLFCLTPNEKKNVWHYMRLWAIIRQCCGSQASAEERNHLHGLTNKVHAKNDKAGRAFCEIYNLTRVEVGLFDTVLGRFFKTHLSSYGGTGDPTIGPGFCTRTRAKIKSGYDFNNFKWKKP